MLVISSVARAGAGRNAVTVVSVRVGVHRGLSNGETARVAVLQGPSQAGRLTAIAQSSGRARVQASSSS